MSTGTAPLYYQWQKNGVNISEAYSSVYTTPPVTLSDTGSIYRVIVTNKAGSVTSSQAVLTVSRSVNLIQNPGFESGTTPWIASPTANVTYSRVSPGREGTYAARLYIKSIGRNMQLYQKAISLEPNTRYRLSFAAYSTGGHDIRVMLNKSASTYTNYGLNTVFNLNTTWQVFTTEFTTTGFTNNVVDGSLSFYLNPYAAKYESYYIDSVVLEKLIVSPEVVSKSPTGTNVPVTTSIAVNFSETMNQSSVESAFSISPAAPGSFGWSGNNMTYTPDSLAYSMTYNVTVGTGAMDLSGNNMSAPYEWNFTTMDQDLTPPTVTGNSPTLINVYVGSVINVTFSEAMNKSSVQASFSTTPATNGSFSWNQNTMTYTPDSNLAYSTMYSVTVGTGAKDLSGNNMAASYVWNFTTMDQDTTPPTVSGNSPTGADIPVGARIIVNFSEAMNQSSARAAFSTIPATSGSFSWNGNNMTYTPVSLSYNTTYNVTVGTGAMDLSGNSISNVSSWIFTTVPDTTAPFISGNIPSGSNIPIASAITVTFNEAMNTASVESAFSTSPVINGSFSWNGNMMTYTPNASLAYNTTYNVTVGTGAMDLSGNSISGVYSWIFTTAPVQNNLILNPGFASGKTSWTFYTNGVGTFSVITSGYDGNSANIAISTAGSNMQFYQAGIKLEPNTQYRLSFAAKSNSGDNVQVNLFKTVTPYTNYGLAYTFDLTSTWTVYTREFTTTGFTTPVTDGRLQFWLGGLAKAGDTYNIDNVELVKV